MPRIASIEDLRRLVETLPFQSIADTPTVRYYTNWKVYEELLDLDYADSQDSLPEEVGVAVKDLPKITLGTDLTVESLPEGVEAEMLARDSMFGGNGSLAPFSIVKVDAGKMQAYHALRFNVGVKIRIDSGADFGRIAIVSLGGKGYLGHHILLEVGDGAKGEIVYLDFHGSEGLKTVVAEGKFGTGSRINITNIVLHSRKSAVYILRELELGDKAEIEQSYLISGGKMTRFQDDNVLVGRLSKLEARASTIARPGTATDAILSSLHSGPESEGDVKARGVVVSDGYLSQRGVAMLGETARWASSEVESYVFLLSEKGRGYAVPVLEIHTGDITRAGHSAAVASLAEDTIFYLRSRGLSDSEIVALVMEGIGRFSGVLEKTGISFPWILNFQ